VLAFVVVLCLDVVMSRQKQFTTKRDPLQVRIDPKVKTALKKMAQSERRTLNNYLAMLLEEHVQSAKSQPAEAQSA
jgi:hypothetical protein